MQSALTKGYVVPRLVRIYYQFVGPIAVLGIGLFSILMWYVSVTQDHSQIPCGIIAALFGSISILATFRGCVNSNRIMLQYNLGNGWVSNQWGSAENRVNLSLGVFCSTICITFTVGNSHVKYRFLLYSNSPFPAKIRSINGGMTAINSVLDSGMVVVPWQDVAEGCSLTAWLKHESIADFPRVSFIPASAKGKDDDWGNEG